MGELDMEGMVQVMPLVDLKIIKETLSRMGIANKKRKVLYPTCYIYQNFDEFYIVHFKELFALDGKPTDFEENDLARRNTIGKLLAEWGLIEIVPKATDTEQPIAPLSQIKIISYKEKDEWLLETKYNIGKKREG